MTDTRERALAAALEFWRHVDPTNYTSGMMAGNAMKQGGDYTAKEVVATAKVFADFLDGKKK